MNEPLLDIQGLHVTFSTDAGLVHAVRGVNLRVCPGHIVGLVGESGSGKTVTALAALRLLPSHGAAVRAARLNVAGRDVLALSAAAMRELRGAQIAMIFQDPTSSLNPVIPIGEQIAEAMRVHGRTDPEEVAARVLALLGEVGFPDGASRLQAYPHELSGGQRQRVMIAMAIANNPRLLLADEPTTALDVTVQAQLLALLRRLCAERGMGMLLVSHDLDLVASIADEVVVMLAGEVVESGTPRELMRTPGHPYTAALVAQRAPRAPRPAPPADNPVFLDVAGLAARYSIRSGLLRRPTTWIDALHPLDFQVRRGSSLGIVGESGSGKTTLARALLRLVPASAGRVTLGDQELLALTPAALRGLRRHAQMVFQDANGALDPRFSVLECLTEPLALHGFAGDDAGQRTRAAALLVEVGLGPDLLSRRPHELSGGQRQRVGIARALAVEPSLLICDESLSALDATVQAQVVDLLLKLQVSRGLTYIFISHDLSLVARLADTLIVLRNGRVVESGAAAEVFAHPREPYTRELLAAAIAPRSRGID